MPTLPASYAPMVDEYLARTGQSGGEVAKSRGDGPKPAKPKYRNTKTVIDGRTFDSRKEANRYMDLREEQRAGTISELACQVAFPLVVNGETVAAYVADFTYRRDGRMVIEDVKSAVTRKLAVYRLKAKIMAAMGHTVVEV